MFQILPKASFRAGGAIQILYPWMVGVVFFGLWKLWVSLQSVQSAIPIGSMGLVYLNLPVYSYHKKSPIHVGKYSSPMNPMGYISENGLIY